MKDEYNFSNAEQGKFYVPIEHIQAPMYFDQDVARVLSQKCSPEKLQMLVNDLLRKAIEIAQRVAI